MIDKSETKLFKKQKTKNKTKQKQKTEQNKKNPTTTTTSNPCLEIQLSLYKFIFSTRGHKEVGSGGMK